MPYMVRCAALLCQPFDMREVIVHVVDGSHFRKFKKEYRETIVTVVCFLLPDPRRVQHDLVPVILCEKSRYKLKSKSHIEK